MGGELKELEQISAADFFYRNRSLAGFDNPVRATYTTMRELVENALDASELAGRPPKVMLTMEEVAEGRHEGTAVYMLRVRDNGVGLDPEDVPAAFGKVFVSSKYKLMQSRGTFGLGGTMALLYGQITTNRPFKVITGREGSPLYEFTMKIDIQKNEPIVLDRRILAGVTRRSMTTVELYFEGSYRRARSKIIDYLHQTAIVTPYADIMFIDPDGLFFFFARTTDQIPPPPKETKFHPKGIDFELLKRLAETTKTRKLAGFLTAHFQRVGSKTAAEILARAGLSPDLSPRRLSEEELERLFRALVTYDNYLPPDPSVLSPLGPRLWEEGIRKELRPEFVKAVQRPPAVVEGHPVIVETAIAYGGDIKPAGEIQLYRFANRIPLLYDVSSDVSYLVARRLNWSVYGIKSLEDEPIALFFHVVSTKVPFKTVGKEFIANKPELAREVELGWRACARDLRIYLSRKRRAASAARRVELLSRYYALIAEVLEELTGERPPIETVLARVARKVKVEVPVEVRESGDGS